ncbi:MAG: hypothetical protein IV092_18035 [Burkholderiaceae bacterium]|nr:hypothetical protein [Burkholderiaceae bacterium]
MSDGATAFIATQRALLTRLERFAQTPSYDRLLKKACEFAADDPEPWLLDWLIGPMFGSSSCRLDVAEGPDGVELLSDQLQRAFSGVCA